MTMHDQSAGTRNDPLQGAPAGSETSGTMATAKQAAAETAQDVKATAKDDAANVARQARSEANRLMGQAKQEVQRQAEDRGRQASERLRTFSDQLSALAEGRTDQAGPLLGYAEKARDQLQSLANRIDQRGPQGLIDEASSFARRRPGMFLLAAAGAGFVIGRVVRAEREVSQSQPAGGSMQYTGMPSSDIYGYPGDETLMPIDEPRPLGSAGTMGSQTAASMIPRSTDG